jgi:hypothetical protein
LDVWIDAKIMLKDLKGLILLKEYYDDLDVAQPDILFSYLKILIGSGASQEEVCNCTFKTLKVSNY